MPLISMTSDLTSLKFGRDRRGGGDSGQPYVVKTIPERTKDINFANSFLGNDFLIRGGTRSIRAVLEDELRLSKFFTSFKSANGLLFIAKQELLAMQNPLTGVEKRIYNPASTLGQAAVNPVGLHFLKDGLIPTLRQDMPYGDTYFSKTKNDWNTPNLGADTKNKLLLLYQSNIVTPQLVPIGASQSELITNVGNFAENLKRFGLASKEDEDILFQYIGGPNATSKSGKTTIRKSQGYDTTKTYKDNQGPPSPKQFIVYSPDFYNIEEYSTPLGPLGITGIGDGGIKNFIKILSDKAKDLGVSEDRKNQLLGDPTDYTKFNRTTQLGEGDPGKRGRNRAVYYNTNIKNIGPSEAKDIYGYDKINAQPLYSDIEENAKKGEGYDDFIKFNIGVIDLNSLNQFSANPITTWIHFRAQLESFSDSFRATWNPIQYMGRGNKFYKYAGFERDINLDFKVVVHSKYEQAFVYDKLNYLASVITPNYNYGGYMRGNLIKLTIGDYLNNVTGILNGVNYTINTDVPWDTGRTSQGEETDNSLQLPQLINISGFKFTPIHDFKEQSVPLSHTELASPTPNERYISMGNQGKGYKMTELERSINTDIKRQN